MITIEFGDAAAASQGQHARHKLDAPGEIAIWTRVIEEAKIPQQ